MDINKFCDELSRANLIDLSQTLEEHMPHFPSHSKFFHNLWGSYWHGNRSLSYQLVMHEHNGTHVDAPAHFISDAKPQAHVTIEQVSLTRLMGRGVRLDCRNFKAGDYVSKSFIAAWETQHGSLKGGDVVLFDFGWATRWGIRPHDQQYLENWPGVGIDAVEYLIEKSVDALGVDTLSPDPPEALEKNPIHPVVLEKQVLIIENLCNLDLLPDFFIFLALPLKIKAGSGSPIRAVALV
ncbi:MAG TPA: cyclase family protein [Terriglobia bacterium]|nr:cyclase family protein [Terriglobia bacterium]